MTVLFLHGLAGSRATYDWLGPSLAGHTIVRPDFRGHGDADRTPGAYRVADYAADALAALRAVGPAFVVGHSLGGVAAWWAAQREPGLVLGAVLEDPPLYMGEPAEHAANTGVPHFAALRALVPVWQREQITRAEAAARLAQEPYGPDPSRRAGDVLTPEALAARAFSLLHLDPAVLDPVVDGTLLAATDTIAPVTVPMTILAASEEPAFSPPHTARLAATHPDVAVVRIAGAGHSIHDERAHRDAYLAHVEAALSAHPA